MTEKIATASAGLSSDCQVRARARGMLDAAESWCCQKDKGKNGTPSFDKDDDTDSNTTDPTTPIAEEDEEDLDFSAPHPQHNEFVESMEDSKAFTSKDDGTTDAVTTSSPLASPERLFSLSTCKRKKRRFLWESTVFSPIANTLFYLHENDDGGGEINPELGQTTT